MQIELDRCFSRASTFLFDRDPLNAAGTRSVAVAVGRSSEEVTFLRCHFLIDRRIIVSNHNLDFRDRRSSRAELPTARAHARPCLGKITLLEMTRHKGTQRGASYSVSSNYDFFEEIFLKRGRLV